jgi:hypothetical protein
VVGGCAADSWGCHLGGLATCKLQHNAALARRYRLPTQVPPKSKTNTA